MKGHYWSVHVMGRKKERKDCFCLLVCFSCIILNIVYAKVMHVSCVLSFLLYMFFVCFCCFLHFVVFVCYHSWKITAVFYDNQIEHLRKSRIPSCFTFTLFPGSLCFVKVLALLLLLVSNFGDHCVKLYICNWTIFCWVLRQMRCTDVFPRSCGMYAVHYKI
jgi:hypothetical protein